MNFKQTLAVVFLGCAASLASAQDGVVSRAYEVALSDFTAPATENGGIAFKPCSACDRLLVRVTNNTRYMVNGRPVRFVDFRKAVSVARDREEKTVIVLHHLESDTVVSINASI